MNDSPVNLLIAGHTKALPSQLQTSNQQLKEQLNLMLATLTHKKEQNLKYLKEIDNQQDTICRLKEQIELEEKRKQQEMRFNVSQQFTEHSNETSLKSDGKDRTMFKSMEIPHKRAYLDLNNKSIEASFDQKIIEKKLKMQSRQPKPKSSLAYGPLYNKQSFSLNRLKLK